MNLFEASIKGDLDGVKRSIEEGIIINKTSHYGYTALSHACISGHLDVVKFLVENGANLNVQKCGSGYNPLMLAAEKGHSNIVVFLLESGADVSLCTENRHTALWLTCLNNPANAYEIVKILHEYGADLDAPCHLGRTPLKLAVSNRNFNIAKYLIERGVNLCVKDRYGYSAFNDALLRRFIPNILLFAKYASRLNAEYSMQLKKECRYRANLKKYIT